MPIRPENLARYPKEWSSVIVPRIARRSGNRCECTGQCGVAHLDDPAGRCRAGNGELHPITGSMVVLTVMHLNHQPEDCRAENLLHGCQRCHNLYDAGMRRKGIAARAFAAISSKMGDLFEGF